MQLDDYRKIKQRAARRLLRVPGINAVGLGGRIVGGRPTGDVAIKVFVTRKRPASEVPPDELVPASIEGVPTDVVELGRVRRATGVPGVTRPSGKLADFKEYSPLRGGISVATEGKQGFATLGCLLVDPNDSSGVYALTNHHVVTVDGKLSLSRQVAHPSTTNSTFDEASSIGIVAAGIDDGIRDAAIVRLATGGEWLPLIEEIGWVRGTHDVTLDEMRTEQYQVRKRGTKTGLTGGVVVGYDVETAVEGSITKGNLIIRPNADPADPEEVTFFSFEGDSGSAVVNEANEVVGLFYATDHDEAAGTIGQGIVTPIATVLRAFKDHDHLDLQVAVPKNANPTEQNEVRSVDAPVGSPHMGGPEEIARGDHAQYRPLTGGAQILAAPMLGPVNSTTLGCMVTEVADSQK
ncbi:MAG TPA: hypothetical protein VEL79_05020, partial [Vicinamibacterales bacterium]|nr:hypothetical protein [Vicinamibacterales bacterium]